MKKVALLLAAVVCFWGGSSVAAELKSASVISQVTVYPHNARVTRTASINLTKGEHSIVFDDIIPQFNENSLSVSGVGKGDVTILGAYVKTAYLTESSNNRVKELEAKLEEVQDHIKAAKKTLEVVEQEKKFIASVQLAASTQIPEDTMTKMPSATELQGTLDFITTGVAKANTKELETNIQLRGLYDEQTALREELRQLRTSHGRSKRSIVVNVDSHHQGVYDIVVSYLVEGASWRAVYDARVDHDNKKVALTTFGVVAQSTGEDWSNVTLTFSTAKPNVSGSLPEPWPWVLRLYDGQYEPFYLEQDVGLKRNKELVEKSSYAARESTVANFALEEGFQEAPAAPAALAQAEVSSEGVAIEFENKTPADVTSDGSEHKFPVATQTFDAEFKYAAYTRLSQYAYLQSRVTNSNTMPLIAGPINLFLDEQYIGQAHLNSVAPGEEFDLSLGIDEAVKVKKELVSKEVDTKGLMGMDKSNKTMTYQYKITLENYKKQSITFELFESMPVTQQDDLRVKITNVNPAPTDKDWEDREGVWRWTFPLTSGAKKEIMYTFTVEHHKDKVVQGL